MSDTPITLQQRLIAAGVSRPYAIQLSKGDRTPSLKLAIQLQDRLGIPANAWRAGSPPQIEAA